MQVWLLLSTENFEDSFEPRSSIVWMQIIKGLLFFEQKLFLLYYLKNQYFGIFITSYYCYMVCRKMVDVDILDGLIRRLKMLMNHPQ